MNTDQIAIMFDIAKYLEYLTFEQPLGVLLFEGEQLTGSLTDAGKRVLDAPYLTLVAETILSDDLQLLVETRLLEGTTRRHIGFGEYRRYPVVHHLGELKCYRKDVRRLVNFHAVKNHACMCIVEAILLYIQ